MPKVSVRSMSNSGSLGTMICCKLAQRASLNIIHRIDLLSEILFGHDRFGQILGQTYAIVFGFSASMSTSRHGTFKWTMGVIALATAAHGLMRLNVAFLEVWIRVGFLSGSENPSLLIVVAQYLR